MRTKSQKYKNSQGMEQLSLHIPERPSHGPRASLTMPSPMLISRSIPTREIRMRALRQSSDELVDDVTRRRSSSRSIFSKKMMSQSLDQTTDFRLSDERNFAEMGILFDRCNDIVMEDDMKEETVFSFDNDFAKEEAEHEPTILSMLQFSNDSPAHELEENRFDFS